MITLTIRSSTTFDNISVLTNGLYYKFELRLSRWPPPEGKIHSNIRYVECWWSDRVDPWLKYAVLHHKGISGRSLGNRSMYVLVIDGKVFFYGTSKGRPGSDKCDYSINWMSKYRGRPIVVNITARINSDRLRKKEERLNWIHEKIKSILPVFPATLTLEEFNRLHEERRYLLDYVIDRSIQIATNQYSSELVNDQFRDKVRARTQKYLREGLRRSGLGLEFYLKRKLSDKNIKMSTFIEKNQKKIRQQTNYTMEERLINNMKLSFQTINNRNDIPLKTQSYLIKMIYSQIICFSNLERWIERIFEDQDDDSYKFKTVEKIWRMSPELSLKGLMIGANDFLFDLVESGEWNKSDFLNAFHRVLRKGSFEGITGADKIKERLNKFQKNDINLNKQESIETLYPLVKKWWERVKKNDGLKSWAIPNYMNEPIPIHVRRLKGGGLVNLNWKKTEREEKKGKQSAPEKWFHSVRTVNVRSVKDLISQEVDVNARNNDTGDTALMIAARQGDRELVELLLEGGANVNMKRNTGDTALHEAAMNGYPEVAKTLIEAGAKIEAKNQSGWTPLLCTAVYGREKVMKRLLQSNAMVNIRDNQKDTALMKLAGIITEKWREMLNMLVESGAELNVKGRRGWTPLMEAAGEGYYRIVQQLIEKGANLNTQNEIGNTAAMEAAKRSNGKCLEVLNYAGADLGIKNTHGNDVYQIARTWGNEKVEKILEKEGK